MSNRTPKKGSSQASMLEREVQGRSLQLADEARQRHQTEQERQKLLKRLRSAEKSLHRFQNKDLPQFEDWKQREFGRQLADLQKLEAIFRERAELVMEVEEASFFTGRSYGDCYEKIKRAREQPAGISDSDKGPFSDDESDEEEDDFNAFFGFDDDEGEEESTGAESLEEEFRRFMRELFGGDVDLEDPVLQEAFASFQRQRGFSAARTAARPASPAPELKKLYRSLARRLHPDHREELAPERIARLDGLWHETQEAYGRGDGEELLRIESSLDLELRGITEQTPVERIQQAMERDRQALRTTEREVRLARKTPAWMFSKKRETRSAELRRLFEEEIRDAAEYYAQELASMKRRITSWETEIASPDRKRRYARNELRF